MTVEDISARPLRRKRLAELAALFFRLGLTAFGGPAAHIAMMGEELVKRRGWLTRQQFLDLLSATNLIPGPNSTEMAIHIGYVRAGLPGLLLAGTCFILPAAGITLAFAWAYVQFGRLPSAQGALFGIAPAVVAVILGAAWRLGRAAAKTRFLAALGLGVMFAALLGVDEIVALFAGGLLGTGWLSRGRWWKDRGIGMLIGPGLIGLARWAAAPALAVPVTLTALALFFLKIGSVLYGSGYVLIAFLQGGLVEERGWLTQQQLLDAVAVGQFTPGPVLSTATFIGYVLAGWAGAVVATAAIFLPSFLFVLITNPIVPRLRQWPLTGAFLDAVGASAVGLIGAVIVQLGRASLTSAPSILIFLASLLVVARWKVNPAWVILGGGVVGWVVRVVGWG